MTVQITWVLYSKASFHHVPLGRHLRRSFPRSGCIWQSNIGLDIIVICFINFYEKHFLSFFDLFLILLHLWKAGGQLIDINVHWQIQFTFYFLWDFISLLFTQASNLSILYTCFPTYFSTFAISTIIKKI